MFISIAYKNIMVQSKKPEATDDFITDVLTQLESGIDWNALSCNKNISKTMLYKCLLKRVDNIIEQDKDRHILNETPRDRLFEILMLRFDVLNEYRKAYRHLFFQTFKNPKLFRAGLPLFHQSMETVLRMADTNGRDGHGCPPLRTGALALVYLNAVRVWLNDDTSDMSKTMAELDRGLSRLDQAYHFIPEPIRSFV